MMDNEPAYLTWDGKSKIDAFHFAQALGIVAKENHFLTKDY